MRDVLRQSDAAHRQLRAELEKARTRAEAAEATLGTIQAERVELDETRLLLEAALAEQAERVAEIEELRSRATREQENAQAAHERMESARATVRAQDQRIDALRLDLEAAELRAASAEEYARLAGDRAAEQESLVREAQKVAAENEASARAARETAEAAKRRVAAAEERATEAEAAALDAVDNFRRSTAFGEELADATAGSYLLGFRDCKEKVGCVFGLTGLEDFEPDDLPEESGTPEGPANDEAMPTEEAPTGQQSDGEVGGSAP